MVFAEARRQLIETVNDVKRTEDLYELIELFFRSQLDSLFGEE
jgi:hypothetical protein